MNLNKQKAGLFSVLLITAFIAGCAGSTYAGIPRECFFYPQGDHDKPAYQEFKKWKNGEISNQEFNKNTGPGMGTKNVRFRWNDANCAEHRETAADNWGKPSWADTNTDRARDRGAL